MYLKMTKEGYQEYLKAIEQKKKELIDLGIFKGQVAVECGNVWHDNYVFEQTEIQERALKRTIFEMERKLPHIEIVEKLIVNNNVKIIDVDSVVKLKLNIDNEEELHVIKLVGTTVNNTLEEISLNSPMGKAIYKKIKGNKGQYNVGKEVIDFEIMEVN